MRHSTLYHNSWQLQVYIFFIGNLFFLIGCGLKPERKIMDINQAIKDSANIDDFLSIKYRKVDSLYHNPIYPYQVNYRMEDTDITFCNLPLVESWALKNDASFNFFIMIKDSEAGTDIVKVISSYYGVHFMESNVEVDDYSITGSTYYWKTENIEIMLERFPNVRMIKKYDNCFMLLIGNMDYKSVFPLK
jgi:hypothetical protein